MSKVRAFEEFINNLQSNKQTIIRQLADKEDKIKLLERELETLKILLPSAKASKDEMASSLEKRIELTRTALKKARDDFQALNQKHADLNPEPLATNAVQELDAEIMGVWKEFGEAVTKCQEARKEYLTKIAEMGSVCNQGNNKIELAIRIGRHTTDKPKNIAQFQTHLFPYSISIDDVKAAYYRGKV